MFKGYNIRQQHGFPNLNFFGDKTAYGQGGCNFWLKADFGLNTQTNLGAVSRWVDSISGYIFEQSTAGSQPRLLTSSASYNNLPVVDFFDAARFMTGLQGEFSGVRSYVVICNYDTIRSNNIFLINGLLTDYLTMGGTDVNLPGVGMVSGGTRTTGTTDSNTVKICIFSDNLIMVNGVVESTATNRALFSISRVGGGNTTNSNLTGKIGEIIGFSQPLNTDQATAISNQLNAKYLIY